MRIGLVAVDGHNHFPNLALMRLSTWHKRQGDTVECQIGEIVVPIYCYQTYAHFPPPHKKWGLHFCRYFSSVQAPLVLLFC